MEVFSISRKTAKYIPLCKYMLHGAVYLRELGRYSICRISETVSFLTTQVWYHIFSSHLRDMWICKQIRFLYNYMLFLWKDLPHSLPKLLQIQLRNFLVESGLFTLFYRQGDSNISSKVFGGSPTNCSPQWRSGPRARRCPKARFNLTMPEHTLVVWLRDMVESSIDNWRCVNPLIYTKLNFERSFFWLSGKRQQWSLNKCSRLSMKCSRNGSLYVIPGGKQSSLNYEH